MSSSANPLLRLRALPDLRLRRARLRELVLGGEDELLPWLGEVVVRARDGDGDAALTVVAWGSLLVQAASEAELTEALAELLVAGLAEASDEGEDEDEPPSLAELFIEAVAGPAENRRLSPRVKLEGGGWLRGLHTMPVDVWQWRPLRTESVPRASDPESGVASSAPVGVPSMAIDAAEVARIERERELGRQEREGGSERLPPLAWIGLARPRQAWLTRAYRHDGPLFRKRLLAERWLTERDVVLMAALRPSTEEMLLTIARDDRWFFRARVREALCNNPYTPSWLVASLLPAASGTTRRQLTGHRDPRVAALAEGWRRGPVLEAALAHPC